MSFFKECPQCGAERPSSEAICEGDFNGVTCGWDLVDQAIKTAIPAVQPAAQASAEPMLTCPSGHPYNPGDVLCLTCGADLSSIEPAPEAEPVYAATVIEGWEVQRRLLDAHESSELFEVKKGETAAVLTLYRTGAEPDTGVQTVLQKLDPDHVPAMLETGRFQERAFEVSEFIRGAALEDSPIFKEYTGASFRRIADELGRALRDFGDLGLRHREITPKSVLLRSEEPLDLVVTRFGSARLSDYDLESVSPLELTRYSAPEAIVGGVSVASDWWSLGVILLEHLTAGACFSGINDKAFQIHVVTRGIPIPQEIEGTERALLRGLLTRDPLKRWKWAELNEWLEGRSPPVQDEGTQARRDAGPELTLGGKSYADPTLYALSAAEAAHWEESKSLLLRGALATWLDAATSGKTVASAVRSIALDEDLDEDEKHAVSLMHLNPSLPLIFSGDIVSPAWLLKHPERGYSLINGPVSRRVAEIGRERWLTRLSARLTSVREKAAQLSALLDESRLRVVALSTSRANLDAERALLRKLFPEAHHEGLAGLMDHDRLSDEELIILVAADHSQFMPLEALVEDSATLAQQHSIGSFKKDDAREQLVLSRRDLYQLLDTQIAGFSRCSIPRIDEWADSFRIERRIALPRAVLILAIPKEAWREPPRQQYVSSLLDHFGKKVDQSIQQGPLVRFIVGKTTARVDLLDMGSGTRPATAVLDHLLRRGEAPISVDPEVFTVREGLLSRFRKLISNAQTFRRETGIDGRYLGFPFLVVRSAAAEGEHRTARIAPVLLWPVSIEMASGNANNAVLSFDKTREEVRLNPALSVLLPPDELERFKKVREEVLSRPTLRAAEVIDLFGRLVAPTGRELIGVPSKDTKLKPGERRLSCSAALFNAEFTGQAIAEDLRNLRNIPPSGTALESALRVTQEGDVPNSAGGAMERFHVVESDPSQEAAVLKARERPGLLVEGPPGTGKSQTIVNIVADCIARNESVLVVCQKQVALKVVQKRLEAEGLGGRLISVVDPQSDRQAVIRSIREQVEVLLRSPSSPGDALRRSRRDISSKIQVLENELTNYHNLLHKVDEVSGRSYRQLLCSLIDIDQQGPVVSTPALRPGFTQSTNSAVEGLEDQCSSLSGLWIKSKYEGSPLSIFKSFSADEGVVAAVRKALQAFADHESSRSESLKNTPLAVEMSDPAEFKRWIIQNENHMRSISDERWRLIAQWLDLFTTPSDEKPAADRACQVFKETAAAVRSLVAISGEDRNRQLIERLSADALAAWVGCAAVAAGQSGSFDRLSPERTAERRRAQSGSQQSASADERWQSVSQWIDLFKSLNGQRSPAEHAWRVISDAESAVQEMEAVQGDERLRRCAESLSDELLATWIGCAEVASGRAGTFGRRSFSRGANREGERTVDAQWEALSQWHTVFKAGSGQRSLVEGAWHAVKEAASMARDMEAISGNESLRELNESLSDDELMSWIAATEAATREVGFIGKLSLSRYLNRKKLRKWLDQHSSPNTTFGEYLLLLSRERDLRPLRSKLTASAKVVRLNISTSLTSEEGIAKACDRVVSIVDELRQDFEEILPLLTRERELRPSRMKVKLAAKLIRVRPIDALITETDIRRACEALSSALEGLRCDLTEYLPLLSREANLRPLREKVKAGAKLVRIYSIPALTTEVEIASVCDRIASGIDGLRGDAGALLTCPAKGEIDQLILSASKASYAQFEEAYHATLAQHDSRESSKQALEALKVFVEDDWISSRLVNITANRPATEDFAGILGALNSLAPYQQFRARSSTVSPEAMSVFGELRVHEQKLSALRPEELAGTVRRTIRKEALLAWKGRVEHENPDLLSERSEIEAKQRKLSDLEATLRQRNRELLEKDIDPTELGTLTRWEGITRLMGARAKRLREVFEEGRGMGLMRMRPVWMMTPDIVSQLLPRTANLFDVVIFDEASQLLVEYAVPSMFRAGRAVVSGDDKQMPPTSFFSSRGAEEEEELEASGVEDFASEEERDIVEEKWNRREIKDCPDLLALAAGCFPATTLQIHYRSKYRELIAFSNAAFYKGALSVPAKHPDQEVRRARPIKVVRVDGVYQSQTNPEEAARVVEELADLWSRKDRPSTCVVTFNKKQADLVHEAIEERAASDEAFLKAYNAERSRTQDGEDMGFIVRNVENVQGDERDVVIFSTTFGRNSQGSFRRVFGALGQKGGERRLNVAITRARMQVVLVTSMPISDVSDMLSSGRPASKPRDYLQGYLDYSAKVSAGDLEMAQLSATRLHTRTPSKQTDGESDGFVSIVEEHIRSLGMKVTRGASGDTFSVDLAVESSNAGHFAIAIECDSPTDVAGHLATARARDVWRPKILRRAIPAVHRVSSHGWYHDPADEKRRLDSAIKKAMAVQA